jgi:hypothetical protein
LDVVADIDRVRSAGLRAERSLASRQFHDGRFRNTGGLKKGVWNGTRGEVLREWVFGGQERRPPLVLPVERPSWDRPVESGLRATWLGHSTVLLEIDGRRVLTDPVFANRIGPGAMIGPRRFHPTPVGVSELPPLDAMLVSHDHFDHL